MVGGQSSSTSIESLRPGETVIVFIWEAGNYPNGVRRTDLVLPVVWVSPDRRRVTVRWNGAFDWWPSGTLVNVSLAPQGD